MASKRELITSGARAIVQAIAEDGLPSSFVEMRELPARYGVELFAVYGEPGLEAELIIDARDNAKIRYDGHATPSVAMLLIWHEVCEYLAITGGAQRSLFDDDIYRYDGPGRGNRDDIRHRTAVRCEELYVDLLRAGGFDVRVMERRLRSRRTR